MISMRSMRDNYRVTPGRFYIGGKLQQGGEGRYDQDNPSTNEVVTNFIEAGRSGVDAAVAAARRAFDEGH